MARNRSAGVIVGSTLRADKKRSTNAIHYYHLSLSSLPGLGHDAHVRVVPIQVVVQLGCRGEPPGRPGGREVGFFVFGFIFFFRRLRNDENVIMTGIEYKSFK